MSMSKVNRRSGFKYVRSIPCSIKDDSGITFIDVYTVLDAYVVQCPARQHAVKKLLCAGLRGKGDVLQDLQECLDVVKRAIEMEQARREFYDNDPKEETGA